MRLFIISILSVFVFKIYACDFCGGSAFGLDANMISSSNENSIGLLFSSKNYKLINENQGYQSWLFSWTLNGTYKPHNKVQIKAFLPLLFQTLPKDKNQVGLGDLMVITSYTPLNIVGNKHSVLHRVTLSGGLELPTGKDNSNDELLTTIPFSSKSVDFLLGGSYALSIKRYVMGTSILGKVNTKNQKNYKYGNSIEAIWQNSIRVNAKDAQLFPFVGVKYNWQKEDISNNFTRIYTGGYLFSEIMGIQVNYYKHKLAAQIDLPFYKRMKSTTSENGNMYSIQYTYQF